MKLIAMQRGQLTLEGSAPLAALVDFEAALERCPDHAGAIIHLSHILLDIYEGKVVPPPTIPPLSLPVDYTSPTTSTLSTNSIPAISSKHTSSHEQKFTAPQALGQASTVKSLANDSSISEPATLFPDRFTARERAHGLLSSLTQLGTGWNSPEAWFTLARAHELAGMEDKSREALWWCVDCEEARGVRGWDVCSGGDVGFIS